MSSERTGARLWVALIWGETVLAERAFAAGATVSAGTAVDNDLVIPERAGLGERHRLFAPLAGGYSLEPGPGRTPRTLEPGDRGVVELGPVRVFYDFARAPARLPRPPFLAALEPQMLASFNAALMLHLAVLVAAFIVWDEAPALSALPFEPRDVRVAFDRPRPAIEDKEVAAAAMPGEEGEVGDPDRDRPTEVPRKDGPPAERLREGRPVGAMAVLDSKLARSGVLGNLFGNDAQAFGGALDVAMAGHGDESVRGHGTGGLGLRGLGNGGGGERFGALQGMGPPGVPGAGRGTRARLARRPPRRSPAVRLPSPSSLTGFCRESDIRRVVETRSRGVSFCYEKALVTAPELGGKLTMRWVIGLDGRVSRVLVDGNTLGERSVARCVRRQIERWTFPPPEGGQCVVSFPFVFSPGT